MIEAIIQCCEKKHAWSEELEKWVEVEPFDVYFVVESPAPGITVRGGSMIENPEEDPLWGEIRRLAESGDRAGIETVEPMQHLEPTIIKAIKPIAD